MTTTDRNLGENHALIQDVPTSSDYQSQYEEDKAAALLFHADQRVGNQQPEDHSYGHKYNPGK